jgi:hypothetical protein
MGHPCSVEIAASATAATTFSRGATRFGFGLASSCRPFGLNRSGRLARTGQGFLVVADAAAGTAGLRERHGGTDRHRE